MKQALIIASALVAGATLTWTTFALLLPSATPLAGASEDSGVSPSRLADLERRLARLEHELASLAAPAALREPVVAPRTSVEPESPARATRSGAPGDRSLDPRALLAEYVRSFESGGGGSEFFRLAVAAYAHLLQNELAALLVDRSSPDELRVQIVQMFGNASFRGDAVAIDALLSLLRQGGWERGAQAALAALTEIGDRVTAGMLIDLAPALEPLRVRCQAYAALVKLFSGAADPAVLQLFERERDPAGRAKLIELFTGSDLEATLRAFDLASRDELPVRLAAAPRIGGFRDEPYRKLVDDWLAREEDEQVRALLGAARTEQRAIPSWHELQACGPPDVADPTHDDAHAWASQEADGGREWLELTYDPPRRASGVTVYEVCAAGAVVAVELLDPGGTWQTVWSGTDPLRDPGPFEIRFRATSYPVKRIRIELDTARTPGWNEIDAVELSGPDGSAWASGAAASSRYGAGRANASNPLEFFGITSKPKSR